MKETYEFRHKKVLVLGLAKSGTSAANLLHNLGAIVTVNDRKPFAENPEAQELLEKGIKVICGEHPDDLLDDGFELIVKNPGIPYSNFIIQDALRRHIPVITEVELAYRVSEAEFIGITGTNGKTTTTTLIYEILRTGDRSPLLAGNIGIVASDVVQEATSKNIIVTELSSFQLLGIDKFRPKIAVITNLYSAHLDYHGSREEYLAAKENIIKNQGPDDYLIINLDQEECRTIAQKARSKVIGFSRKGFLTEGASYHDGSLYFHGEKFMERKDIPLPGDHNLENILAALAVAKVLDVDDEAIRHVLRNFQGVKHRLQYIGDVQGRKFYNDSKSTNVLATQVALKSFTEPVILLAGGLDRGEDFSDLIPYLKSVKALVAFGETKEKLAKIGKEAGLKTVHLVENVEEAVPLSYSLSQPGDIILLSPACASWDQYPSFEVRGDIFIAAVHKLK